MHSFSKSFLGFVVFCLLLSPSAAREQTAEPKRSPQIDGVPPPRTATVVSRDDEGRVTLKAIRLDKPLVVDGLLEESIYGEVEPVTEFIQQDPAEGEPATEETEAWVFFDDSKLYISARCWDSHPEKIVANELRRDSFNIFLNDNFTVVFDTFLDRRNGFMFYTNPVGGLTDGYITDEREHNRDWNTVWDARTKRFESGWTVEMEIPFKSLRYRPGTSQVWGINFRRVIRSKNEFVYLTPIPRSYGGRGIMKISSAATLVGIEAPASGKNLELKPYVTANLTSDRTAEPPISNDFDPDAGFDLKYGVTRSLIADFTFNTDFAQVEIDEQPINLTRFSLFFPEKREFFLEGQGIFAFGGAGNQGSGGPPGRRGSGRRSSELTPILFYSRRIGLQEGMSIPILAGGRLTGKAGPFSIGALNIQTRERTEADAAATNFTVLRLKKDILSRSSIGVLATNRSHSIEGDGSNQVFGLDAAFAFREEFRINTYLAKAWSRTLRGNDLSYTASFDYSGDRYGLKLEHLTVGENFNPEVGFLRRNDFRRNFIQARFSPRPKSIEAIRKWGVEGSFDYITDGEGLLETRQGKLSPSIEFENGDQWSLDYQQNYEFLKEEFEISDGVIIPIGGYNFQTLRTNYSLGPQRKVTGNVTFEHGSFFDGKRTSTGYRGRIELTYRFSLEPGISFNWVDLPYGNFTAERLSTRINLAISPRMFLGALLQYNSSNNSLGTNVRFRWEYQPGSDFFVVYSEGRDTGMRGFPEMENRSIAVKFTRLFRF